MAENVYFPDWRDVVVYAEQAPQPQVLVETEDFKSVIIGLAAGLRIPPHVEGQAIFHFLEGSGLVIVGEREYEVRAGSTVFVPEGAIRGIEAKTKLALLAVRLLG